MRRLFRALPSIARALQYRGAPTTVPWKESVESYGEARAKDYPREEWHHMDEEDELLFSSYSVDFCDKLVAKENIVPSLTAVKPETKEEWACMDKDFLV